MGGESTSIEKGQNSAGAARVREREGERGSKRGGDNGWSARVAVRGGGGRAAEESRGPARRHEAASSERRDGDFAVPPLLRCRA